MLHGSLAWKHTTKYKFDGSTSIDLIIYNSTFFSINSDYYDVNCFLLKNLSIIADDIIVFNELIETNDFLMTINS